MRVGIVSDTHIGSEGRELPDAVLRAFQGVGLILHCGDLGVSTGVLDLLETVAPVKAVRGYMDTHEAGDRLADVTRVVQVGGFRIGVVHDVEWPGPRVRFRHRLEFPPGEVGDILTRKFGGPVEIVAFGDTHEEYVALYQGVLFVNPGSPTFPGLRHRRDEPGTVALLDIEEGVVSVEIVKLRP